MPRTTLIFFAIILLVSLAGCTDITSRVEPYDPGMMREKEVGLYTILEDTTWEGRIRITGDVYVAEGATLTIKPGTVIRFDTVDPVLEEDGGRNWKGLSSPYFPGAEIMVRGRILASGTPKNPIVFTSADKNPRPGAWGAINLLGSNDNVFEYCRVYYAYNGVHNHASSAVVTNCIFIKNGTALSFKKADFDNPCKMFITHNYISENKSGIAFRNSLADIAYNDIKDNEFIGIWVKEGTEGSRINHNNITGNPKGIYLYKAPVTKINNNNIHSNTEYNIALAEMNPNDVDATNNWWGTDKPDEIRKTFYDKDADPALGRVIFEPFLTEEIDGARHWSIGLP